MDFFCEARLQEYHLMFCLVLHRATEGRRRTKERNRKTPLMENERCSSPRVRIIITARYLHPHRLIVITLGAPAIVKAALTTAVEMTKTPEQRRSETPIFLSFETRNCHRIGTGMVMMRPSVRTFRMTRTQKFWGRNVQRWLGSGRTTQLLWNLENRSAQNNR